MKANNVESSKIVHLPHHCRVCAPQLELVAQHVCEDVHERLRVGLQAFAEQHLHTDGGMM